MHGHVAARMVPSRSKLLRIQQRAASHGITDVSTLQNVPISQEKVSFALVLTVSVSCAETDELLKSAHPWVQLQPPTRVPFKRVAIVVCIIVLGIVLSMVTVRVNSLPR